LTKLEYEPEDRPEEETGKKENQSKSIKGIRWYRRDSGMKKEVKHSYLVKLHSYYEQQKDARVGAEG
jgi:hypothetical protein